MVIRQGFGTTDLPLTLPKEVEQLLRLHKALDMNGGLDVDAKLEGTRVM